MSKSAQRLVFWICIFAVALTIITLATNYVRNSEFRTAAAWHKTHGDIFLVDEHKLNLPRGWWGKSEDGKLFAVKASRNLTHTSQSAITIDRTGIEESKRSGEEIRKRLESFVNYDRQKGNNVTQSSLVVVRTVSTNLYCLKSLLEGKNVELRCEVVGAPVAIKSIGPPETEKEIESILSTFD